MSEPAELAASSDPQSPAPPAAATPPAAALRTRGLRHYLAVTRGPWYSFLFVLPVLLTYEVLVWAFSSHVVNGADAILSKTLQPLFGLLGATSREQMLAVVLVIGGISCFVVHRRRYRGGEAGQLHGGYFAGMLVESVVYALCFGAVVNSLLRAVVPGLQIGETTSNPVMSLGMALGAGIYEELFFRVLLMGGLAVLLQRLTKTSPVPAWLAAALLSALIFSAFHYVGNMADAFSISSFLFRFGAGVVLAAIYGLRGFGVAVWTHALFDVLVMVGGK
jgi:membrane protease YdiL (CAAX protease family)